MQGAWEQVEKIGRIIGGKRFELLRYLVQEELEGRGNALERISIAERIFPGQGEALRSAANLDVQKKALTDALVAYYEGPGAMDPIVIRIEKGSYRPVIMANRRRLEEAHRLYNLAKNEELELSPDGLARAVDHIDRALELDPGCSAYLAMKASCLATSTLYSGCSPRPLYQEAEKLALEAMNSSPVHWRAYIVAAAVRFQLHLDWAGAEQLFLKAFELNGQDRSSSWWTTYLYSSGRVAEAVVNVRGCANDYSFDSPVFRFDLAIAEVIAGNAVEALRVAGERRATEYPLLGIARIMAWEALGCPDKMVEEVNNLDPAVHESPVGMCWKGVAYGQAGKRTTAYREFVRLRRLSDERYVAPTQLAAVLVGTGELDRAAAFWREALRVRDPMALIPFPFLRHLRREPDFQRCLAEIQRPKEVL